VLSSRRSVSAGLTGLRDWRDALVAAIAAAPERTVSGGLAAGGPLPSTP
jgi:dTDP-4-dehydrorhamnose reductase